MRLWPFGRRPKREHSIGEYTEPSFRGAILMLFISLAVLTLLWIAYSWALGQPGIQDPNATIDQTARSLALFVAV